MASTCCEAVGKGDEIKPLPRFCSYVVLSKPSISVSIDFEAKPVEEQKLLSIFYANNYDLITRIDEDLSLSVSATKMKMTDIDKGIALCNESITAFEQAKTDYSNISGGDIYISTTYEKIHSRNREPV